MPGDIDAVNALKVKMDKGERARDLQDPHVPASALKLWFRELAEPIIPAELYDECINVRAAAVEWGRVGSDAGLEHLSRAVFANSAATSNPFDQASNDPQRAVEIIDQLPDINRTILMFITRFLQVRLSDHMRRCSWFLVAPHSHIANTLSRSQPPLQIIGMPENQPATKMTYDNLSMVWAPNFLRCPSDDPMVIFNNTKREMTFVRQLVLNLDTEPVAPLMADAQ